METWRNWTTYREALQKNFGKKKQKNPSYSLRAYARDLGVSPSRLSGILNGKFGISVAAADKILDKLDLSSGERWLFKAMVESEHARSPSARQAAREYVVQHLNSPTVSLVKPERFDQVLSWQAFAIMEMSGNPRFKNDPVWIAGKLGLKPSEVTQIIEKLIVVGMLRKTPNGIERVEDFTFVSGTITVEAIRQFQFEVLARAQKAILTCGSDEMEFDAWVISIERKNIREAQVMIKNFLKEFCRRFGRLGMPKGPEAFKDKDAVYCVSNYFYPLAVLSDDMAKAKEQNNGT